jgi:hypothetical protein
MHVFCVLLEDGGTVSLRKVVTFRMSHFKLYKMDNVQLKFLTIINAPEIQYYFCLRTWKLINLAQTDNVKLRLTALRWHCPYIIIF